MTAIVGVINSQGIAIAADSAVTVSGINVKKVYNRSNKIFTLSIAGTYLCTIQALCSINTNTIMCQ